MRNFLLYVDICLHAFICRKECSLPGDDGVAIEFHGDDFSGIVCRKSYGAVLVCGKVRMHHTVTGEDSSHHLSEGISFPDRRSGDQPRRIDGKYLHIKSS